MLKEQVDQRPWGLKQPKVLIRGVNIPHFWRLSTKCEQSSENGRQDILEGIRVKIDPYVLC